MVSESLRCGEVARKTKVLLIDDVFTYGSTIEAYASAIASQGGLLVGAVVVMKFTKNQKLLNPALFATWGEGKVETMAPGIGPVCRPSSNSPLESHDPRKGTKGALADASKGAELLTPGRFARLALLQVRGVTAATVHQSFSVATPTSDVVTIMTAIAGPNESYPAAIESTTRIVEGSAEARIMILPFDDPLYPEPLRSMPGPPLFLFTRGQVPTDWNGAVAIIGTRSPDVEALDYTKLLVRTLAHISPRIIVSGLAVGIDSDILLRSHETLAHQPSPFLETASTQYTQSQTCDSPN